MSEPSGTRLAGARGRLVFLVVALAACVLAIVGASIQWGSLSVEGRLVVVEGGLSLWQGVLTLVVAAVGALAMGIAVASGRGRLAAAAALGAGAVIVFATVDALAWLVTRPDDIVEQVKAGAAAIPLKGYVAPAVTSTVGSGAWLALVAGILLVLAGLLGVVVPAWRRRGRGGAR